MRHKHIRKFIFILCSFLLTGCGGGESLKQQATAGKEECTVEVGEEIQIGYAGETYTVLEESVSEENLGNWVGYVQQVIAAPGKKAVSVMNVYEAEEEGTVFVDIDGIYRKAVQEQSEGQKSLHMETLPDTENTGNSFAVNLENADEIFCGDRVYRLTEEEISGEKLGSYLGCIGAKVTCDADTGKVIASDALTEMDWTGEGASKQNRVTRTYTNVYEIQGKERASEIAVEMNGGYWVARVQ